MSLTSMKVKKEFFNTHSSSHRLSQSEIGGDNPCYQHLSEWKCLIGRLYLQWLTRFVRFEAAGFTSFGGQPQALVRLSYKI
jgi:hypothetical protein